MTSDPPGAKVSVDGRSTGKTTPAELELGGMLGGNHTIRIEKAGFEPEERRVTHFARFNTSKWNDGATDWSNWSFPLFWTFGDMVFPFEYRWAYVPHRVHVKLFVDGTFDASRRKTQEGDDAPDEDRGPVAPEEKKTP